MYTKLKYKDQNEKHIHFTIYILSNGVVFAEDQFGNKFVGREIKPFWSLLSIGNVLDFMETNRAKDGSRCLLFTNWRNHSDIRKRSILIHGVRSNFVKPSYSKNCLIPISKLTVGNKKNITIDGIVGTAGVVPYYTHYKSIKINNKIKVEV